MSMQPRNTCIAALYINTVSSSGVVQLGDNQSATLNSRSIAVQRAIANNEIDDQRFAMYELFTRQALTLAQRPDVRLNTFNDDSDLQIGWVKITGVSGASTARMGCGGPVTGTSRIKHIRNFNNQGIR